MSSLDDFDILEQIFCDLLCNIWGKFFDKRE